LARYAYTQDAFIQIDHVLKSKSCRLIENEKTAERIETARSAFCGRHAITTATCHPTRQKQGTEQKKDDFGDTEIWATIDIGREGEAVFTRKLIRNCLFFKFLANYHDVRRNL
jgi:hypothetical protein